MMFLYYLWQITKCDNLHASSLIHSTTTVFGLVLGGVHLPLPQSLISPAKQT